MTKSHASYRLLWWPLGVGALAVISLAGGTGSVAVSAQLKRPPTAAPTRGGPLPTPLPLFPATNWWNLDITNAPVAANSAAFISFIGVNTPVHPDLGNVDPDNPPDGIYGIPYVVVDSTQPLKTVQFLYSDESDGVDHNTDTSFPFYPIPDEAITQPQWIEGGPPGNQNPPGDRHMLIVDKDNKFLYELFDLFWNGTQWTAGSGAFFDMKTNNRRPDTWTSADAAGLAILPGLIRYDEVHGTAEIGHAFRMTVSASNGYVYPASHAAGSNPSALPMGARLRLKPGKNITGASATPEMQRIVAAMKKYGLIVADNGSNMYVTGTYNPGWDSDPINAALGQLKASDFDVIQLGYNPPPPSFPNVSIGDATVTEGNAGTVNANFTVTLSAASADITSVVYTTANGTTNGATSPADYTFTTGTLTFNPGETSKPVSVPVVGDTLDEFDETFFVNLSSPVKLVVTDGQGLGTITDDDAAPTLSINDAAVTEGNSGTAPVNFTVSLSAVSGKQVTVNYATANVTALAGIDYTAASGTLTFPAGTATRPLAVSVVGDVTVEATETFAVNLTAPVNATIADAQGIGTINDNDAPTAARTFASAGGSDANDCSVQTTPCRNLAPAIFQVAAAGEVIVLTPGEYETAPLTITKSVKVTSPSGTVAFVRQPITVNAPGGRVVLRGLTIKGAGAGDGITLTAADALSIEECNVDRWSNGLNVGAASGSSVSLTNSVFAASTSGVQVAAGGTNRLSVEGSRFEGNGTGLLLHSGSSFVRESTFLSHTAAGISIDAGSVDVQRSEFSLNFVGVSALTGGTARIARSRVFGNATGLSAAAGSTFESYGTNVIRRNGTNTTGTITAVAEQ